MLTPSFHSFADELHGLLVKEAVSQAWVEKMLNRQVVRRARNLAEGAVSASSKGSSKEDVFAAAFKDKDRLEALAPRLARKWPESVQKGFDYNRGEVRELPEVVREPLNAMKGITSGAGSQIGEMEWVGRAVGNERKAQQLAAALKKERSKPLIKRIFGG